MRLLRSLHARGLPQQGCVLTIGTYDAVHIGHQQILRALKAKSTALNLPLVVMTFAPRPAEFFHRERAPVRLTNLASRYFALAQCGVDVMLCLPFNRKLAQLSAADFIQTILVDRLAVRSLLVGDDFRFGRDRRGDYRLLQAHAAGGGFDVARLATVSVQAERVSSSRVRAALLHGDLATARQLLGRPYSIVGRVLYGRQLGRQWGFPTLNLRVGDRPALTGVFAVRVAGIDAQPLPGVANLGWRPTVNGATALLEVHLFDVDRDLYGRRICVAFLDRIRAEKKFASLAQLQAQIADDVRVARARLESMPADPAAGSDSAR